MDEVRVTSGIITLLTDFGLTDHYAGAMKGVILGIAREARIVDLSHDVTPYQIREGGYLLGQSWRYFPEGTTHVAVIDPGVGSERRAIVAEAAGHRFVLPDNGLLASAGVEPAAAYEITNAELMRSAISRTFHGRDIFAPAAAHFARGTPIEEAGRRIEELVRLEKAEAQVIHIDRFGNIVTSYRAEELPAGSGVRIGGVTVREKYGSYAAAPAGELFLIEGSGGFVEISMRQASAAEKIGATAGTRVEICG